MDSMTSLVVGEEGCAIKDVVDVFFSEVNSIAVFKSWRDIAIELNIDSLQIEEWRLAVLHEKLTVKDISHKILATWKKEKGKDATLPELLKHLEKLSLKNVADDLRKFFSTENRVHKGELFKPTLPNKPSYYIPRTLITRSVIDSKVFSSTHKDVFVLHGEGINRYWLSQLAKKELTDTSTHQVRKPALSVRFILLEHFGDWALLCGKTKKPIHLLRHHEGRFHWICTKGDISALQKASDEKNQNVLSEEEFIDKIETDLQFQTNQPICISDSPGMGKSLLLAIIGRQLQQRHPQRIIAFIVISEFVVKIRALLPKFGDTEKAVLEALLQTLCENKSAQEHLVNKIVTSKPNPSTQVELMFDGFDEVATENIHRAHECLKILIANFTSVIRVWITTRPQHLHELEKRFSVLGYNIQAFQEENQIDFLTSYWSTDGMKLDRGKLQIFSKTCLKIIKKKLNKKDEDIAGIPLQCMLIAEVYMQDAHRVSDCKNQRLENCPEAIPCIDVNCIADLYEKVIAYKIEKFFGTYPFQQEEIRNIWPLHMYLALQLIFPSHAHQFKDTLQVGSSLQGDYLVNIGILERRGTATKNPPRFIHRTFAEYLAARFFVFYVIASPADLQNRSRILPNFLFKHVLKCSVRRLLSEDSIYYKCSFKHLVLCHFLDALLLSRAHIDTDNCISQESTIYIKDTMYACIHSDFGSILRLIRSLKYAESFCVNSFDSEILIDATKVASLDLLKNLLQSFEQVPVNTIQGNDPDLRTALHAAVCRGNFTIFEYILKEHHFEDLVKENERFLDLVYWTVSNTARGELNEIQDRVQIVTALCDLNSEMINYCYKSRGRTPLLAYNVNIILLKKLIECGANLFHVDNYKNTILHRATVYLSPTDYYDLLQFIPRTALMSLLQRCKENGETILHLIVKCGLASREILNLILSNGVDINTTGEKGFTCIFYAFEMKNEDETIQTVKLLLENGADQTRVDHNGDSIVHYSVLMGRIDCLRYFLEEQKLNVNQINNRGETPIFHALRNFKSPLETVKFLLQRGADHTILNSKRDNLLHYSAKYQQMECLQFFLTLNGLDINQRNDDGNTPLMRSLKWNHEKIVEVTRLLLDKGADHTIANIKGNNVLHRSAKIGNSECFSHFVTLPSLDVNARNCNNDTPLHISEFVKTTSETDLRHVENIDM